LKTSLEPKKQKISKSSPLVILILLF
jgi:hypothetical protein